MASPEPQCQPEKFQEAENWPARRPVHLCMGMSRTAFNRLAVPGYDALICSYAWLLLHPSCYTVDNKAWRNCTRFLETLVTQHSAAQEMFSKQPRLATTAITRRPASDHAPFCPCFPSSSHSARGDRAIPVGRRARCMARDMRSCMLIIMATFEGCQVKCGGGLVVAQCKNLQFDYGRTAMSTSSKELKPYGCHVAGLRLDQVQNNSVRTCTA